MDVSMSAAELFKRFLWSKGKRECLLTATGYVLRDWSRSAQTASCLVGGWGQASWEPTRPESQASCGP